MLIAHFKDTFLTITNNFLISQYIPIVLRNHEGNLYLETISEFLNLLPIIWFIDHFFFVLVNYKLLVLPTQIKLV